MASQTLTRTGSLQQPRRTDWRAVFGIFLTLLAVVGSIAFWTASSDTRSVVIATRDLPTGATLTPADLAIARVRVDDAIYEAAVSGTDLTTLVGKQTASPVYAHQILTRAQVSSRPRLGPNQLALTIPVAPESAVGGAVQPGNLVEVLVTTDKGKPEAKTTVVLPRATVYDVGHAARLGTLNTDSSSASTDSGPVQWLTLVVTQEQAVQLAQAKWAGELDVALLPPTQGSDNGGSRGPGAGQ